MCMSDLTDMYAQAQGLQARGQVHTYQSNKDCTCYNCYIMLSLPQ